MRLSIIAAVDDKLGIGKNNGLAWKIKDDLRHFRELTTGHVIIMGRKTFESIGRALPNRTNIVVSSHPDFIADGCLVANTLVEAIDKAKQVEAVRSPGNQEVFIIGGGQIFAQAMPLAQRLYLTQVKGDFGCDIFFPQYSGFSAVLSHEDKEEDGQKFTYLVLEAPSKIPDENPQRI